MNADYLRTMLAGMTAITEAYGPTNQMPARTKDDPRGKEKIRRVMERESRRINRPKPRKFHCDGIRRRRMLNN